MNILPNIRKIAVLRATALGDYVAATPALSALRKTYPDAEMVYLGRPWHKKFIEERPSFVDRALVIPISYGVRVEPDHPDTPPDPHELAAFFLQMQTEQFDLAIQMHGGGRNSNPFLKNLGAKFNIGMKTPDAPELDRWIPYVFYQNELMRLVELVRLVGAIPDHYEPLITLTNADHQAFRAVFPDLLPGSYGVIHPGASDLRRRWPPERFAQVGDALANLGLQVVITGVASEREVVESVIAEMRFPAIDACERLSMGGLAALLAQSAVVISNDTGPMHLANAVNAPNVGIFWCGNMLNWGHFNRSRHRSLPSWTMQCPLCGQDMMILDPPSEHCTHQACFVAGVTVESVIEAAFDLVDYDRRYGRRFLSSLKSEVSDHAAD
ncbi:MAG: glycosyltransferase family 9 protein [Anaerolineae bacterium]|jgi:ADP-heptose:LPS heptosyltransferase|nr:glycosyltransferase family 9 protein [Anaerolineae bacterium]